jgi:DNA-directed RNA polymerase subunit RPC12/RpoP
VKLYRCLECGHEFEEPRKITETHGLDTPPYEILYVCPECQSHGFKCKLDNSYSRTEIIDKLVDIMQALNEFDHSLCAALNLCATDGTLLDDARGKIFELLTVLAGDDEFELPSDTDDKVFSMQKPAEVHEVYKILTKSIEE